MRVLISASLLVLANVLFGQDSLKTIQLEEVAVISIRASDYAPVSQLTMQREEIQAIDLGQDASVTLEKLTPSIISFSDAGTGFGNYNQFRLRGVDQTRVNITMNGVPLNDMLDQGVFFSNFVDFSNSVESFQVQRGVGLSSNGTASYAGSINYESRNLDTDPSAKVGIAAGSFGTLRLNGNVSTGRLSNDFAAYASVSRIRSDGYKYHSGSTAQSFFFSGGNFFENGLIKLTAFAGKTQNDQSYLPVLLTDIQADPRTNYFSPNDTDDFEQEMIQLEYSTVITDELSWRTTAYYSGSRGFFPFFDSFSNSQTSYALTNDQYGLLSNLILSKSNFQLTTGIFTYLFERTNETATTPQFSTPLYSDETEKNEFSAFAKAEYDLNQLTLFADVQVRGVTMNFIADTLISLAGVPEVSRDETFFNPRIGATYALNSQANLYASFGRTGREPTRTDLLQGDFNSAISVNNFSAFNDESVIESEFVNDIEVGFRQNFKKWNILLNGFYMDFENEISIVGGLAQNSYVLLRQNVANSNRSGLELVSTFNPSETLELGLQATYMQTSVSEFDTGVEILRDVEHVFAPDLMIAPSISWKVSEDLRLTLDARYVGESFMELGNDPGFLIPSFFVTNMNARWNVTENIVAGLWLNNMFDEQYFTDGAPVDLDFDGTPEGPGFRIQPPRNFFFSLNLKF